MGEPSVQNRILSSEPFSTNSETSILCGPSEQNPQILTRFIW
uniref:Uncharacterized protein n=1 Tax=Arundo donax TaxID=35708 RepID=A0A0A8Y0H7_ARUDO